MKRLVVAVCWVCVSTGAWAEAPSLNLRIKDLEQKALATSERLKGAEFETVAQESKAESGYSLLLPRLSLEASYRYQTVVPSIQQPSGLKLPMGDNTNYSVGPALTWTALDFGATHSSWKSQQLQAHSKREDLRFTRRQVLLGARLAYYRVASALEQQKLVSDSLKLAQSQYRDIKNRNNAGSSSRIDLLSSHKEVLSLEVSFRQAQSELAVALQDLLRITGELAVASDLSRPLSISLVSQLPEELAQPTVLVRSENLKDLQSEMADVPNLSVNHPQVAAIQLQAASLEQAASATQSGLYPRLQLQAKASYDYPNGTILESVQQNALTASLSFPLFEFSRTRSDAAEKSSLAQSLQARMELTQKDLERDLVKTRDQLQALRAQRGTLKDMCDETTELSRLIYSAYQNGRSSILEVQSANLKALDAGVQAARNEVQILIQQAILQSLTSEQ